MLGYKGKIDFLKKISELCGTLAIEYWWLGWYNFFMGQVQRRSFGMATEFDLENMKERLEYYEERLEEALRANDESMIRQWKLSIARLEEEIRNLEYELRN